MREFNCDLDKWCETRLNDQLLDGFNATHLHVTDIVEIVVVEERDALQSQQWFQTMLRIAFKQSTKQIFRCIVHSTRLQHSTDIVDPLQLVLISCTLCIINLIEIFELIFAIFIKLAIKCLALEMESKHGTINHRCWRLKCNAVDISVHRKTRIHATTNSIVDYCAAASMTSSHRCKKWESRAMQQRSNGLVRKFMLLMHRNMTFYCHHFFSSLSFSAF